MASIVEPSAYQNPFRESMCEELGRCKNYLPTDLYVWLVHLLNSSTTWEFANDTERVEYIRVLNIFKKAVKTDFRQALWYKKFYKEMFPKKTAQSQAIQMIEQKNMVSRTIAKYPPPIFHASCKNYYPSQSRCQHPSKPIDNQKITNAWYEAFTSL
jgi:hypothetical protein